MDATRVGEVALTQVGADRVLYSWTVHPIVDRPVRTALLVAFAIPFFWVIVRFFDPAHLFVAMGLLVAFLSGYFFPTTYELTDSGVHIRSRTYRGTKRWSEFASFHAYSDAVYLLHEQGGLRTRLVRGSLLLFKRNREQVLEIVQAHIDRPS